MKNRIKASVHIIKVSRNAKATILISALNGAPNITREITNKTIEFDVVSSGSESKHN